MTVIHHYVNSAKLLNPGSLQSSLILNMIMMEEKYKYINIGLCTTSQTRTSTIGYTYTKKWSMSPSKLILSRTMKPNSDLGKTGSDDFDVQGSAARSFVFFIFWFLGRGKSNSCSLDFSWNYILQIKGFCL